MTMTDHDHYTLWVCTDCYFAHHYGIAITAVYDDGDELLTRWYQMPADLFRGAIGFRFYAGDTGTPSERLPLRYAAGGDLTDNTCSNHYVEDVYDDDGPTGDTTECPHCGRDGHEDGVQEFSWRTCDGCGSHLGGSRYRLALFPEVSA